MSLLIDYARAYGVELSSAQAEKFDAYYQLLIEWNQRFNLTRITDPKEVEVKHFLDSISAAPILQKLGVPDRRLIDIGTGAGFPGVPLALVFPKLRVLLLEATGKKVTFLEEVVRELGLANVVAVHGRVEELAHQPAYREEFDYATARAVAPMRTLVEYALPVLRVGGVFIAYRGSDAKAETAAAQVGIARLGGTVREIVPVTLPTLNETRHLVVVAKTARTPDKYPRQKGLPVKHPL